MTHDATQIPGDWQAVRLGDVAEVNRRQWDPSSGSTILYLDLTSVAEPGRLSAPQEIPAVAAPSRARRRVQDGDILVSTVRPYLRGFARVIEAPENLIASTGFAVLTPQPISDGSLLYHHVMSPAFVRHLEGAMTGQAYPAVRPDDVASYRLGLPPLPEQRAIAAVLDGIDGAIERTEEVIAATERLRDALLHELLTRGLPGRHSEWVDVPGLGTVPACWDVVRLGDVAHVQTGRAVNKNSPRNGNVEVPYLSVANVKDGYLDLSGVKTMVVSQRDLERYGLQVGDVLFTEGGDADKLGRGTVWQGEIEPCLHQNHVFAVRPQDDALFSSFLSAFAGGAGGRRYFLGAAKQTTNLASMNSTQLKSMPLPLPTVPEQRAIIAALEGVDDSVERAREERARLQSLQASASDALLTGRTRFVREEHI